MEHTQLLAFLIQMSKEYPTAVRITVDYCGDGDKLDSFRYCYGDDKDHHTIEIEDGEFLDKYNDVLWHVVEAADLDYGDRGAEGEIIFDLATFKITLRHFQLALPKEPNKVFEIDFQDILPS